MTAGSNLKKKKQSDGNSDYFNWKQWLSPKLMVLFFACVVLPIVVLGSWIYSVANPDSNGFIDGFTGIVGKKLPADVDGYTNFLLLGTGDASHEGPDLTDTIIVASVNQKTDRALMFSIPRDLFIKPKMGGNRKINSYFATIKGETGSDEQAYSALMEEVGMIIGRPIHDYVRVDFSTFAAVVDYMGGVYVNVKEPILDTAYPGPNYSYQTFRLNPGIQLLDGETALKYARTRHSGAGDFDRSLRQQELIFAIKEAAKNGGVLRSPKKIQELYQRLSAGIDTSLEFREIVSLAGIAYDYEQSNLISLNLNTSTYDKGGFLYTPPREAYGGSVALPLGNNYEQIKIYLVLHYNYPELMSLSPSIKVYNGTTVSGLASMAAGVLSRYGFEAEAMGNAQQRALTVSRLFVPEENDESDILFEVLNLLMPVTMGGVSSEFSDETQETFVSDSLTESGVDGDLEVQKPVYRLELGADSAGVLQSIAY